MAIWYMRQGPEPKPSPALAEKLNISTFLQELLWRRNIVEENDVNAYLDARLSGLINPNQWPQIPEAADFIVKALLEGKKLVVWGDYDVDGTTSTALVLDILQYHGFSVLWHIPDRHKEGYGINVNAIEDYKNISERYEFMNTQRNDLVKAEETLLGIIKELDTGMRRQFEEQFAKIRVEFDKAFRELFGGGKGTLELEEDADVLEAGVRIIAQPPGKKLQNMMQLSGGEKALTAISLLFAIQNLKPSPFCLLDEIEAALDDSNVGRFAKYLHKLTNNTQFIIITHRKGTMEAADRLYGITMQEKGVSALVSVNLIEEELDE